MIVTATFRSKMARPKRLKVVIGGCIAMILANILWLNWIFSFFWGFFLIYGLEELRKEKLNSSQPTKK